MGEEHHRVLLRSVYQWSTLQACKRSLHMWLYPLLRFATMLHDHVFEHASGCVALRQAILQRRCTEPGGLS